MNKQKITSVKLDPKDVDWLEQQAEANSTSVSEILRRCLLTVRTGNRLPRSIVLRSQSGESFSKDVKQLAKEGWNCKALVRNCIALAGKQSDSDLRVALYDLLKTIQITCFDLARLAKLAGCVDEETLGQVRRIYPTLRKRE